MSPRLICANARYFCVPACLEMDHDAPRAPVLRSTMKCGNLTSMKPALIDPIPWMSSMADAVMASAETPLKTSKFFSFADAFDESAKIPAINNAKARIEGRLKKLNKFKDFTGCFLFFSGGNHPQIPFFFILYA